MATTMPFGASIVHLRVDSTQDIWDILPVFYGLSRYPYEGSNYHLSFSPPWPGNHIIETLHSFISLLLFAVSMFLSHRSVHVCALLHSTLLQKQ